MTCPLPFRRSVRAAALGTRGPWRWAALLLPVFFWGSAAAAREQAPGRLTARLVCPPRAGPGRIVCQVAVAAPSGSVLRWSDALVVRAPDFALPLRARVVASLPEEGAVEALIAVPVFASAENTGTLEVRARAVVCPTASSAACVTLMREVSAPVAVTREVK